VGKTLYVANNDRASVVSIAIKGDGSPGETKVIAGPDCDNLGGADGVVVAPDGSLVVAANRLNKLVAVSLDGKVRVIAAGTPLDFPASVGFDGGSLIATNFALFNASSGKPAMPGLIRIGAAN
jgi:sugar lactone lactonase YvrE